MEESQLCTGAQTLTLSLKLLKKRQHTNTNSVWVSRELIFDFSYEGLVQPVCTRHILRLFALKRLSFVSFPDWILHSHNAMIPLLTAQVICDCSIYLMACVYFTQLSHPVQSSQRRRRSFILTQLLRSLTDWIQARSARNKSFKRNENDRFSCTVETWLLKNKLSLVVSHSNTQMDGETNLHLRNISIKVSWLYYQIWYLSLFHDIDFIDKHVDLIH